MSDKGDVQYYEEVHVHPIFSITLLFTIGLMVYLGVAIPQAPKLVLVLVSAMLCFIYITFMTLKIIITPIRLTVRYGIISHSVKLSNIEYIETRKPPWYWYGGLGIRFGWDWSTGFIQNFKRGVRVTPVIGRRLFFSTNNPDAIVNIVNDLLRKMSETGTDPQ